MNQRVWYIIIAVVIILILAYLFGLFGGGTEEVTAPVTTPAPTTTPVR